MRAKPYRIIEPDSQTIPLILSLPHCGTDFPERLRDLFIDELAEAPDDTDWYLDILYDFAPSVGATTIRPIYSRWVVDLNREPSSTPLYDDGRLVTALCPTTDFNGRSIYVDGRSQLDEGDINRRLREYFYPYHQEIESLIKKFLNDFGVVLFWDGHSIRRHVPTIRQEPFPDFILGDNDGASADPDFTKVALSGLRSDIYTISHNMPFKGGYLTRSIGKPASGIHALQLEMSKDLYMTGDESIYSEELAKPVKEHLERLFGRVIERLMRSAS